MIFKKQKEINLEILQMLCYLEHELNWLKTKVGTNYTFKIREKVEKLIEKYKLGGY